MPELQRPHVFITYAWGSPFHQGKVVSLAKELARSCHVELDQWSLRTGENVHAFMERIVNDPRITKVVVICDRTYAEKSRAGKGGVGTETTIMSAPVYEQLQSRHRRDDAAPIKFIPVVFEFDEQGRPYMPVMFSGAMYVDMSTEEKMASNMEDLTREIWDRPGLTRPEPVEIPAFMEGPGVSLPSTSGRWRALQSKLEQGNPTQAEAALQGFLDAALEQWATVQTVSANSATDVEALRAELLKFKPLRDELEEAFRHLARQRVLDDATLVRDLTEFFEQAAQQREAFLDSAGAGQRYSDWTAGHLDLMVYEAFLLALAAFLQARRWEAARQLAEARVFVRSRFDHEGARPLTRFIPESQLFESLQRQTGSRAYSEEGKILQERASQTSFDRMCEAESVVFLRSVLGQHERFYPVTVPYWNRRGFEVFQRSWGATDEAGLLQVLNQPSRQAAEKSVREWMAKYQDLTRQWSGNHQSLLRVWGFEEQTQPSWRNW